ncbi:scarecrow-like protein 14 isoform X2 [Ricinus communis]|uniref:scarecrow-like protein 14 isoform X2 n=1 Tax=Ricinus communis TaxID=3988 RepID=UPI000772AF86|nr:scarecrow-like protein 14 isoform X2 [Ricinus communis]|eukprot:XP_002531568.2 scarecrow-like protein 14 isoform X2 [Ricinus communis]
MLSVHFLWTSQELDNGLQLDRDFVNQNYVKLPPYATPSFSVSSSTASQDGDLHEDFDFSDVVLKYISDMLMEEDIEEKTCMFQESSAALQAAEKSLYELIGEKYPPSINYDSAAHLVHNHRRSDENHDLNYVNCTSSSSSTSGSNLVDPGLNSDLSEYKFSRSVSQSASQSSNSSGYSIGTAADGLVDSPLSTISEIFSDSESILQFKKGFEEASKFLPNGSLFIDLESTGLFLKDLREETKDVTTRAEENHESEYSPDESRGKKNPHPDGLILEGRSNKQSAVYTETTVSSEDFDTVLLNCGESESALRVALQNEKNKDVQQNGTKGSNSGKGRGKKQKGKSNVVDLRTLLTLCAQAVAADDRRNTNDLLKQIRQNASPTGDGMQRMAHIFADGLEARMAGSGTQIYKAFMSRPTTAADVLKAHHLFLAACPFRKLSNFFSNKTIMNIAQNATTLHIIDFGILYGFQWPCLIQRLSSRPGGPPKLRITGIDFPHPGFRPAERVEETGHRLSNYAKKFNVPFEFNAIAQKWDTVQIEQLKIDKNEVLVVNCLYRLRNLLDETVVVESPRTNVLNLIREMNPDVFITGIVNGAYNAPFFITRFREAVFHYSTLFDMLETNVPREIPERMLIEREIFGWEAKNVIACEGAERIERPETYKQWQVRILRAGFRQLPLNKEIYAAAKEKVNALYHKDFVIDEDSRWLLQGWKGRIVYALSSWEPDH